jgi:hypothetical protein
MRLSTVIVQILTRVDESCCCLRVSDFSSTCFHLTQNRQSGPWKLSLLNSHPRLTNPYAFVVEHMYHEPARITQPHPVQTISNKYELLLLCYIDRFTDHVKNSKI